MVNELCELPLLGGRTASEVVRIGDTVRRPLGPRSEFTHDLLEFLEEKRCNYAPRYLGVDEKGREILTFMEGDVPHEDMNWTDEQLVKVVQMIRGFHDATAGSELAGEKEVVCHNDIAPWNTVLNDSMPTAFIDFDDSAPGGRVDDLAYFLWTFLEIGSDVPADIQVARIQKLCKVYGLSESSNLVDAILKQQEKILAKRKTLSEEAPTQKLREFSASKIDKICSEIEWVKENRGILEKALSY